LIAAFSGKISELLREREASLLSMQEELAKKERLASLVTLSAGAAHELNTPLGTIAVVAKELERYASRTAGEGALAEDCRLIRAEVERCREVLWRMSVQGAEPRAEAPERLEARALVEGARRELGGGVRLNVEMAESLPMLVVPRRAVGQAMAALVKNAFEASEEGAEVRLKVEERAGAIRFVVTDRGKGMPAEMLRRIGEPFFTTKEPGKGMGLGTFLARTLAEQLGGRLAFESREGRGTSATLELPSESTRVQVV
jgi:two-component system sensor histidine kinase RegB